MQDAKTVSTPLSTSLPLTLIDGIAPADPTLCRRVIGALQYLSFTHLTISFAVNKLSQFMHKPSIDTLGSHKKSPSLPSGNSLSWSLPPTHNHPDSPCFSGYD